MLQPGDALNRTERRDAHFDGMAGHKLLQHLQRQAHSRRHIGAGRSGLIVWRAYPRGYFFDATSSLGGQFRAV